MKFYVVARFGQKEKVRETYEKITRAGHEILYDWTNEPFIKPYYENDALTMGFALKSINASEQCDVFVLVSDAGGTDMYGEFCSAITSKKPKVYVIGDHTNRSKFFFLPKVKRRKTIEEVLADFP